MVGVSCEWPCAGLCVKGERGHSQKAKVVPAIRQAADSRVERTSLGNHSRIVSPAAFPLSEEHMATKLDKSIKRELEHNGKLYTITIAPDGVKVVEKGKRNGPHVSWASIISGDTALNENLKISVDASRPGM